MRGTTVCFVNNPFEAHKVHMVMRSVNVEILTLRPRAPLSEVSELVRRWNDPDDTDEVLILSLRTSSLGLDLHMACHRLVVYSMPEDINAFIQICGRIHRIGQGKAQFIMLLVQSSSYEQVMGSWES